MSRAERLLQLMQLLREYRYPVKGSVLAQQLGISVRTLYRDIQSLQNQGANIEGEAGIGYCLKPSFTLPPLMFSPEEVEALVFGSRWVIEKGDTELMSAAKSALAKIADVIPDSLRYQLEHNNLLIGPSQQERLLANEQSVALRHAIRQQRKVSIDYQDVKQQQTERIIWPFALATFDSTSIVLAWCELREQIRAFRLDRISTLTTLSDAYPRNRRSLLKEWQKNEGITCPDLIF